MPKRTRTTDRTEPPTAPATDDAADEVADEVVTAVLTASRLLVSVSARSLAAVEEALTLPQFRMLVVLDSRGAMNISRLGEHLDVIPSTAMRMVDRLAAAAMLERTANPGNRREILITLTAKGRQTVRQATERRRAEIARIVAAMPRPQRAGLVSALQTFADAGDEPLAHRRPYDDVGW
ncbi:MarR family winged helix-turn-helix transcriptional regulator [Actinacidiphila bryophytorum]|jgi:DNA-binding MarR family transcriptional regulator|uniref:MarR family winged helix-turn-helix transcriptional regulator n=1 Tax=Actinacidiphila bryophytorum TaxID=1436133 RepID=UPI002176D966|nr:MarR family transcriptional regulator [Actinacidiphila bryophytorum]UWE10561.1 MarR family transcriptional regulator [Actinacidiphila bryophytorum]